MKNLVKIIINSIKYLCTKTLTRFHTPVKGSLFESSNMLYIFSLRLNIKYLDIQHKFANFSKFIVYLCGCIPILYFYSVNFAIYN
jgi:hypothetical protein